MPNYPYYGYQPYQPYQPPMADQLMQLRQSQYQPNMQQVPQQQLSLIHISLTGYQRRFLVPSLIMLGASVEISS